MLDSRKDRKPYLNKMKEEERKAADRNMEKVKYNNSKEIY